MCPSVHGVLGKACRDLGPDSQGNEARPVGMQPARWHGRRDTACAAPRPEARPRQRVERQAPQGRLYGVTAGGVPGGS